MTKILSPNAPKPIGPYSQAVIAGNLMFASGQIPLDPRTGAMITGPVEAQTEQVMQPRILRVAAERTLDRGNGIGGAACVARGQGGVEQPVGVGDVEGMRRGHAIIQAQKKRGRNCFRPLDCLSDLMIRAT